MTSVKILLADDDKEDRFIMADAFDQIGLGDAIHFEEDGEKLIEYLNGSYSVEPLPSLIVLDLNMPRMNGTQTLKALKRDFRYKDIPIIIFSTSVNSIEMKECMENGAVSYITKPVTYNDCIETAKNFYRYSEKELS
ncbi:MAG: response regulator [Taibaiella sp.]|nr:response regulator [Taibaiella sp.]